VLVDGNGIPLSLVVSGAERHDVKLLEPTLDKIVVVRPCSRQHLCADKGYMGRKALQIILERGYVPHVRQWGEEVDRSRKKKGYKPRRWKVERTLSWLNRYRKLLVRFEKLAASHEALLELACALTAFRRTITIYG
jgi:putative transposase